jgi:hypothetical protein
VFDTPNAVNQILQTICVWQAIVIHQPDPIIASINSLTGTKMEAPSPAEIATKIAMFDPGMLRKALTEHNVGAVG